MTVDAGLSLRAWRLRDAHAIDADLRGLAGVGNTGAALFVLAVRTYRQRNALPATRPQPSGTSANSLAGCAGGGSRTSWARWRCADAVGRITVTDHLTDAAVGVRLPRTRFTVESAVWI